MNNIVYLLIYICLFLFAGPKFAEGMNADSMTPSGAPLASIDLATTAGVKLFNGAWKYHDTQVIETEFRSAGVDGQPTGKPVRTYDITPHAGGVDFDDATWEEIAPDTLSRRRGNGRVSFNWYRMRLTIPERIGAIETNGSTVVFQTSIDDYAEIWVDGEISRHQGQQGGSVISGWNAQNRLVIGRNVKPGQQIQIAIFGINGPLSNPPTNFIWVREARLEFYPGTDPGPVAIVPSEVNVTVERHDPAIDRIVGPNPKLFKLADGFKFTEGPIWIPSENHLLFSDPNSNIIYRYKPNGDRPGALSVERTPSGYSGTDVAAYGQPGSNGLTIDPQGRLTINEHGNHRVSRIEADGRLTVLADSYDGKRLNSPNDLVYASDGSLFFTDPPFGLPRFFDDPRKELPYSGVFALSRGELRVLTTELRGPNGIALSPDEKYLYVGNWDEKKKVVMRYGLTADGKVSGGRVFFDMTSAPGEDAIDGIKVDQSGNLYVSGPGGLWVLSAEGNHLGTIVAPRHIHNMAWGDDDGMTLYICARSALYKMRLNVPGVRPPSK